MDAKIEQLILVTGPTGSGKSTTLAAMIEHVNQNSDRHIITIEDPIEYKYQCKKSLIHQREVGEDVGSFADALRSALREDPDVILVASGSEVSTLVAGTELLRKDGVKVRIVSAPSEGLFRSQSKEYQESILPADAKIFGLTAGLPVTLQGLVGCHGKIWGLESFGFSAPYTVLDEKLGFTAENVYNQVKAMI